MDWWSRRVWHYGASPVWWNGPEGQFDRYDMQTRLRSETIGPNGTVTRAPARPQGRFRLADEPILDGDTYLLITDDGVLRLNPDRKKFSLERLFYGKVEGWGLKMEGWGLTQKQDDKVSRLWLISGGALWQLDFNSRPVRMIPLSDRMSQAILASPYGINAIVPLENGGFSIETRDPANRFKETLSLLGSDGSMLRQVELNEDELNLRIGGFSSKSRTIPMPIIMFPEQPWKLTTAAMIQYVILSLVLMSVVIWHQARTGRRGWRAFAWSAFTFVTGLAGAMAYVIAHWDKRTEACPGCGKLRPLAQDACPHCNIAWPKPAKSGFEVLETR